MEILLAKVLKRTLKEKRISIKELSGLSGVAVSTLHEWLNGRNPKNFIQAKKVAKALDLTLNKLLFDESDEPKAITLNQIIKEDVFSGVFEISIKRIKDEKVKK